MSPFKAYSLMNNSYALFKFRTIPSVSNRALEFDKPYNLPRYRSDAWFYMVPSVCPWVGWQWGGLARESKTSCPGCFQFDTAYCNLRKSPLRNCQVRLACSHLCGLVLVDDVKETIPLWAAPSLGRWGCEKANWERVCEEGSKHCTSTVSASVPAWLSALTFLSDRLWPGSVNQRIPFPPQVVSDQSILSWWQRWN